MNMLAAVKSDLASAKYRMEDSMKRLKQISERIERRGAEGVKMMEAALADQPTSMSWVSFGAADLNDAQEELRRLQEQIGLFNTLTHLVMIGEKQ